MAAISSTSVQVPVGEVSIHRPLVPFLDVLFDEEDVPGLVSFLAAPAVRRVAVQISDAYLVYSDLAVDFVRRQWYAARGITTNDESATAGAGGDKPTVFVLADNVISQCCPDEVTAKHYHTDAIVQVGFSCFSKTIGTPYFVCQPRLRFARRDTTDSIEVVVAAVLKSAEDAAKDPKRTAGDAVDVVLQGGGAKRLKGRCEERLPAGAAVRWHIVGEDVPAEADWRLGGLGLTRVVPGSRQRMLFVGPEGAPCVGEIAFVAMYNEWHGGLPSGDAVTLLHTATNCHIESGASSASNGSASPFSVSLVQQRVKQRAFNIECVKKASAVGIVVTAAGLDGSRELAECLRTLLISQGKKRAYILYMGCINPAKLANFVDSLDCFIVVACAASRIAHFTKKSDGYIKPLVSPMEALLALQKPAKGSVDNDHSSDDDDAHGGKPTTAAAEIGGAPVDALQGLDWGDAEAFVTRVDPVLRIAREAVKRLNTSAATAAASADGAAASTSTALVAQRPLNLALVRSGAVQGALQRLHQREYVGLDPRVGATPVQASIVAGRTGIAMGYQTERPAAP